MTEGVGTSTTKSVNQVQPQTTVSETTVSETAQSELQQGQPDTVDPARAEEWKTFSDQGGTAVPAATPALDLSATNLVASAPAETGQVLNATTPQQQRDNIVEEARMAPTAGDVDAIIAREQQNLGSIYGSLGSGTQEQREATIAQLAQLSEFAGTSGRQALAKGVADQMDLDNFYARKNGDISLGLTKA